MDDSMKPVVNPHNIYHFEYPMRKQQGQPWSGWTTDPFRRDICMSRGWPDNGRLFSYFMDVQLYRRKKALVVDVPPERGKTQTDSSLQNLRPGGTIQRSTRSIETGRLRNPVSNSDVSDDRGGLSDPLKKANGTVVFVAILQELKEPTVAALKVGEDMSKEEAAQYEKDLNETLKEDPGLKQYRLTAEGLAKMVPHPSASLEVVVQQSDDSLPE
jgi:hypothetical protein